MDGFPLLADIAVRLPADSGNRVVLYNQGKEKSKKP